MNLKSNLKTKTNLKTQSENTYYIHLGANPILHSTCVAKMASYAIFQYNVLAIDVTHNTWTNVIVKMTILRLLGSSDDKEKIGVARPEGPPLR